ncbi:hypothetical protein HY410_01605 [Candidatus Gottesmanbacteria bacterium]|nr:hypothetical protein [Candidatus Gottesmanbacteria bacterium]
MTAVIFDITKPPIGKRELTLNSRTYQGIEGLEGVLFWAFHTGEFVTVDYCGSEAGPIASRTLVSALKAGKEAAVSFQVENSRVEGILRHT